MSRVVSVVLPLILLFVRLFVSARLLVLFYVRAVTAVCVFG